MRQLRAWLVWPVVLAALIVPIFAAASSPLLAWRDPVYIASGLAGVAAAVLLLVQPLLAGGHLPGLGRFRERRIHRWTGGLLVAAVLLHVAGLWLTSPPDVIDALLFASPTPFSAWGVVAMWALFATALITVLRRRLRIRWRLWRAAHVALALVIVAGTVLHALLIEGTMEPVSKIALCLLMVLVTLKTILDLTVRAR